MALQTFCIVVAFAIFTSWAHSYGWDKGSSYALLVTSWVLSLVGWVCWNIGSLTEHEVVTSNYPATTAAPSAVVVDKQMAPTQYSTNGTETTVVSTQQ